ncbi:hypothetical protein EDC94DRAFT_528302 [Helicostylum pulchrum]|nr:hypothetical protein EDC94DRAFT_528302 [Helicostylum pulchrum]
MTLLDDTNSYWWLIRALKASEVGYIPAENIETPFERLARLNKHRNVQVTSLDQLQHYGSEVTSTRSVKKKVRVSKELACQLQIILTDAEDHNVYEEVFEKWDEPMSSLSYRGCDSDDNEEEPQIDITTATTSSGLKKLTPLLNPDFNKSITITESIEPKAVEKLKAQINKPLPKLIPLLQVDEPKEYVPAEPKKITGLKRLLSIGKNATSKRPTSLQNGIEYYLTVKSMDGDEITLEPTDKPLAIFESLSDHLTTPMPSLTYIKRLSMEQPTIKVTRVGVSKARQRAKARFGEDSVIRFSLHKRIKRIIDTAPGQIYVKISFHAENNKQIKSISVNKMSTMGLIRKSSLLRVDQQIQQQQQQLLIQKANQERIDKLVAISTTTSILELTTTALEKFHMSNEDKSLYSMTLSLNGHETPLTPTKTISEILNDSELIPKGTVEKLFVLRKKNSAPANAIVPAIPTTSVSETTSESTNRFVRYILKQQDSKETVQEETSTVSSTGSVLKRLDQAILSLENDKRQLDKFKYKRLPPARSSSLKISGDVFDNSGSRNSISNMDDLELELQRIATSH